MTDESEAARVRRAHAPAPPPRQSSRPPEPRPRTQLVPLPDPPRLIRPSEHLAIVERAMQRHNDHLSPDRARSDHERRLLVSPEHRPVQSPENMDRRLNQGSENLVLRPDMDRRQMIPHTDNAIVERQVERRPPHLMPLVTVVQGPRPSLPPPVPVHRSVAPPPTRMPAPIPQPVMRLPQPRREIQGKITSRNTRYNVIKYVRIRCPVCFKIFGKEPVVSTKCGHVFCKACLHASLMKRPCCPVCNTAISKRKGQHVVYLEDMSEERAKQKINIK